MRSVTPNAARSRSRSVTAVPPADASEPAAKTGVIHDLPPAALPGGWVGPTTIRLSTPSVEGGCPFNLELVEMLGAGSYGAVYRAESRALNGSIAVKVTKARRQRLEEEIEALARTRLRAPAHLRRYVVGFEFAALTPDGDAAVIGMELCCPTTLHDLLTSQALSASMCLRVAHQMLSAVAAVHAAGCVHRDIKLQNFCFTQSGDLRLVDFGVAATSTTPAPGDTVAGTVSFMAPEMAQNALTTGTRVAVGLAADTWSTGIAIFSLLTRRTPYRVSKDQLAADAEAAKSDPRAPTQRLLERVARAEWSWPDEHKRMPGAVKLYEMVDAMLNVKPTQRPTVAGLLKQYNAALARRAMTLPPPVAEFLRRTAPRGSESWAIARSPVKRPASDKPADAGLSRAPSVKMPEDAAGEEEEAQPLGNRPAPPQLQDTAPRHSVPDVHVTHSMIADAHDDSPFFSRAVSTIASRRVSPARKAAEERAVSPALASRSRSRPVTKGRGGALSQSRALPMPSVQPQTPADPIPAERILQPASIKGLAASERRSRVAEQALLRLQLAQLHAYVRELEEAQDIEWFNLTWLATHSARYARHPHSLCEVRKWPQGYDQGFTCDGCYYNTYPSKKGDHAAQIPGNPPLFFHCSCGMDLCNECAVAFAAKRRCEACGKEFKTMGARQRHKCAVAVVGEGTRQSVGKETAAGAQATRAKRSREAKASTTASTSRSNAPKVEAPPAGEGSRQRTRRKQPSAEPPSECADGRTSADVAAADFDLPEDLAAELEASVARHAAAVPELQDDALAPPAAPLQEYVRDPEAGPAVDEDGVPRSSNWRPFGSSRWLYGRPSGVAEQGPTDAEVVALTDGGWLKWLRNYEDDRRIPDSVCYQIEPGRFGCVAASTDLPGHSAVYSPSEQRITIIESVSMQGSDNLREELTSPTGADIQLDVRGYRKLLDIVAREAARAESAHRAFGLMSALQAPPGVPASLDKAMVYVRSIHVDGPSALSMVQLSSGRYQILARTFDLRWFDPQRIFLVRSSGQCELLDMGRFEHRDAVIRLVEQRPIIEGLSPL